MIQINGTPIHTGAHLGFMSGNKQFGEIIIIKDDWVTLKSLNPSGFQGSLIAGELTTTMHISDTWVIK